MLDHLDNTSELRNDKFDNDDILPVRVVLIADYGEMFTLLLPSSMDGRYRFVDSFGQEKFPVYFEAENGKWVAHLEDSAYFFALASNGVKKNIGKNHELRKTSAFRFFCNGQTYFIYTEIEEEGDHLFLPYYLEERTDYVIGRSTQCHICYPNSAVSREHACLHWNGVSWKIIDKNSTNGTYVNGEKITSKDLAVGDVVFIVGLYLIIGSGYISINNSNDRISFSTPKIRQICSKTDIEYSKVPSIVDYKLYERSPRHKKKINANPIEIDSPPMTLRGNNIPLLLRLGTPMLMGGQALMSGNILMAMSSMVLPTLTQGLTEKDRKEYEKKRLEGYRKYLAYVTELINDEKNEEEQILNINYPPLTSVLQMVNEKKRLWDRRKSDSDFLSVRIGYGDYEMIAQKKYQKRKFQIEPDVLEDEMYEIAEKPVMLNNVPVNVSLVDSFVLGLNGSEDAMFTMTRNMILQIASSHSYDEVKIVILVDPNSAKRLNFVRYLPHNWSNDKSMRFFITSNSEAQQFTAYINKEDDGHINNSLEGQNYNITEGASYVIFALSKNLYDNVEVFKRIMKNSNYSGFSVICAFDLLPKECGKVITFDNQGKILDYFNPENEDQLFSLDHLDNSVAIKSIRKITETKLRIDGISTSLPSMITFLEMFNAGKVEHINPLERWENNNAVKSLAAPVGIGVDGKYFMLDLHEKFHGPHGLVAGMTGSGKSEFLITYILSMAVNYSPDEVAFVLIDYKGGGLAGAFEDKSRGIHLPHLVGTITNLDGAAINRSLMSIKSELKRRQAVFKKAKSQTNEGTMDIYDYQKLYRNKRVSEPMPHLIIIADEFAEMKAQQPEFMNELISTARIGRSLGVHLVLATQKPSGVVNDQIRSNTKFQVCLKVQDRSDSMDMIKRPDAAELKQTGRFYLQVGYNEFFAQGQSAWCGAEYTPQDEIKVTRDTSVQFVDNVGQPILSVEKDVESVKTGTKQIVAIVKYLSDIAKREKITPKSLWLNPLPNRIDYDELTAKYSNCFDGYMKVLLGMVDDPEMQSQFPFVIDFMNVHHMLVCGGVASGKSSLIRTLLLNFVERYTPEYFNYYIIDLSAGALKPFSKLSHCGGYLTEANEGDINRMFALIQEIIEERKSIFADSDVTNYNSYCEISQMPMILLIIDGFSNIKNLRIGNDIFATLQDKLKGCANYGIKYVVTANHPNELSSKSRDEFDFRISLNAKDRYEYNDMLEAKCSFMPPQIPGRGLCIINERVLEHHVAMPYNDNDEQSRTNLLKERLQIIENKYSNNSSVRKLPIINQNQEYADFCIEFNKNTLPLGYVVSSLKPVAMPFHQLYSLSLYFGNPNGVKSIFDNLVCACEHNNMDLIVIRRNLDTLFGGQYENQIKANTSFNTTIFNGDNDGLQNFSKLIFDEIKARNVFRDEYCAQKGILETDKTRVKQAEKYIRSKTVPLLVIFESFADVCSVEKDDHLVLELCTYLSKLKGYNIYFVGCFYPNEGASLLSNQIMKCFNKEENYLLFGGQYNKQNFIDLPMDYRRVEQISPNYDRYIFKYRGGWHVMHMPCGQINDFAGDPEDMSII